MNQLIRYYQSVYPAGVAPPTKSPVGRIVLEGDSLSDPRNPHGMPATAQFQTSGSGYYVRDYVATAGQTLQTMVSTRGLEVLAKYRPGLNNIVQFWGGANDLVTGRTLAQMQADYTTLCVDSKAVGFKVIAWLIMNGGTWDGVSGYTAAQETQRQAFNTWLSANYTSFADYLVDPQGVVPTPYSAPNWSDNVHPTSLGFTSLVPAQLAAFSALS